MKNLFGAHHGLDEKSIGFITNALEKANLPGFDYIEYRQAVDSLKKMNLDEATAFKSAFATAATMGLTKEKLVDTAKHYLSILQKEKEQFDAASAKQQDIKIGTNLQQVRDLQKSVDDNELKIKQLQEAVESAKAKIRELDFERDGAAAKIEEAKTKYLFTHQSIVNQMGADIENIQKYL
jgi:chromosome segregation ATPase